MSVYQKMAVGLVVAGGIAIGVSVFHKHQHVRMPVQPPSVKLSAPVQLNPVQPAPPKEDDRIEWIELKEHKTVVNEKSVYADIINHSREPFKSYGDRATTAHETTHGINSYIRNNHKSPSGKRCNGFYVCNDKAVLIEEPKFRKSQIIPFIPQILRYNRYNLYVQGQKEWDDTPLYIYDEWVAYVNDNMVNIDDHKIGKGGKQKTDDAMSCAEFFVYATAVCMACDKHDPEFFKSNQQWRSFTKWHLQRSLDVYRECSKIEQFNWDNDKYYQSIKTGADAKPLRDFLQDKMGMDLKKVFPD